MSQSDSPVPKTREFKLHRYRYDLRLRCKDGPTVPPGPPPGQGRLSTRFAATYGEKV